MESRVALGVLSSGKSRKDVPIRRNAWCILGAPHARKRFLATLFRRLFGGAASGHDRANVPPYRDRNPPRNWGQSDADQGEPEARRNCHAIGDLPSFEEGAVASEYAEPAPNHHHKQQGQARN